MDIKVTHIMADGEVRESVEGLEIPKTNRIAYQLIEKYSAPNPTEEKAVKAG